MTKRIEVDITLCEDRRHILAEAFEGERSIGMASWSPAWMTEAEIAALADDPALATNIREALTNARERVRKVHGRAMTADEERSIIAAALEWSTPGSQEMPA